MRIARYRHGGITGAGIVEGDVVVDAGADVLRPTRGTRTIPLADVELLSPVAATAKIICAGVNYVDHASETEQAVPEHPLIFAKTPNSLVGPGEPIRLPSFSHQVDFEAELGVVVGRRMQRVRTEDALGYVLGYTCVNDVSARDIQLGDQQWTRGKSLDTFCPVGPWIVTADEIPHPQELRIRCFVNMDPMQDAVTSEMVFGVDELLSFISQGITLEPGDLIATGTPGGVGFLRQPPRYLVPGDSVLIDIEAIGSLENPVV